MKMGTIATLLRDDRGWRVPDSSGLLSADDLGILDVVDAVGKAGVEAMVE